MAKWTDEEVAILRQGHEEGKTWIEIGRQLGRKRESVCRKASALGLNRIEAWTCDEVQALRECCAKQMTMRQLMHQMKKQGFPERTYQSYLTKAVNLGLSIKRERDWTDAEVEALRECYEQGVSGEDIVKAKIGASQARCIDAWTEEEKELAREMKVDGLTWYEVSKKMQMRGYPKRRAHAYASIIGRVERKPSDNESDKDRAARILGNRKPVHLHSPRGWTIAGFR